METAGWDNHKMSLFAVTLEPTARGRPENIDSRNCGYGTWFNERSVAQALFCPLDCFTYGGI